MLVVACSGFPIAASRYFHEFDAVEIADSEIGIPGTGTLRRWQKEAPEGFLFSVLAPSVVGASGFAETGEVDQALKQIVSFAKKLGAVAVVFRVPEEVVLNRTVAARVKKVLGGLKSPRPILEAPSWPNAQVDKIRAGTSAIAAHDPLTLPEAPSGKFAYLTLPGPAGHRSRYDDESLEKVAALCRRSTAETTIVVLRNIDMEANAKTLRQQLAKK